ncbi:MAG TPA: sulfatase-like hydrolase/transferase [Candidatus Acidoferrum sp.]|nr:sulfatase-like hydrolase/transferase [Candidatus Acidoferrum sp.]
MQTLIKAVALACGAACCGTAALAAEPVADKTHRPNILLIIGDDIGMDVTTDMYPGLVQELIRQYGPQGRNHPNYQAIEGKPASTPVLDQFAKQGMAFSNTTAEPFCSPTRASILTGLFSAKTKVLTYADPLANKHTSFVQMLKQQGGYSTAVFGKWHMAGLPGKPVDYPGMKPKQAGFDLFKGNMHAAIKTYWDYDYMIQDDATPPDQWRTQAPPKRELPGIAPTTYEPVVKTADAIEWMTAQQKNNPGKPWFVWLAYNLAHATAQQQPSAMQVPELATLDDKSRKEIDACGGTYGSMNVGRCSGETLMRAMTNSLDTVIGKLLKAVDGIDPNTYVIYLNDNGTPMYGRPNLDFIDNMYITRKGRGKGTAYESGTRVAMVIRGPGIKPGSTSREFVHVSDLFATTLSLAGLQAPDQVSDSTGNAKVAVDGKSLTPILFSKASSVRDPDKDFLLAETVNLMTAGSREVGARNAYYKVICKDGPDVCEFYSLKDDPLEEYPLPKPASCAAFVNGSWTPKQQEWHYCRHRRCDTHPLFLQG